MDINVYPAIKSGLETHFDSLFEAKTISKTYKPAIVGFEPTNPTYPMLKIEEIRNTPYADFRGNRETIASLGYKVDIYAKQKVGVSKQDVARNIAKYANDYLTCIGLKQMSWNTIPNDGTNGDLYHIIIMYSTSYFEQRKTILI